MGSAPRRIKYSRSPAGRAAADTFALLQQLEALMPLDTTIPPSAEPPTPWVAVADASGTTYTAESLGLRLQSPGQPTDVYVKARLNALQNLATNLPVSEAWHRLATWAYHAVRATTPGVPAPGQAIEEALTSDSGVLDD